MFSSAYNLPKTTSNSSKFLRKSYVQTKWIFNNQNYVKKVSRNTGYFDERNYLGKSTWKQGGFFNHQNYIEKSTYIFLPLKLHRKKVCGNDVDFSISKITPKKYVGIMWKFFQIWSLMYRHNIHVESTFVLRGVFVGWFLCP